MKFLISIALLFSFSVQANLVDEVDKLTPEQAQQVLHKLQAKTLEPVPETLFTKLSVLLSMRYQFSDPSAFSSSLDSSFGDDFESLQGYDISLMWKLGERSKFGFSFSQIGKFSAKEISSNVFNEVSLNGYNAQLVGGYDIPLGEKWLFLPTLGLGVIYARADILSSNDNASTSHDFNYSGGALSASFVASLMYQLNPVFAIGIEAGYLGAKVEELKRSGETEINTPAEVDFSGAFAGLKIGFNL